MKYLKTFEFYETETGNALDYEVGDTVICVKIADGSPEVSDRKHNILQIGKKYKVVRIYKLIEDRFLKNPFMRVDVKDETGVISKGWESTRFKLDVEIDADKYNM